MDLVETDLALQRTSGAFDLETPEGRRASAAALRTLFLSLHGVVKPAVVLEVGAKGAEFSAAVRDWVPDAQIFAFEANPHNFERFSTDPRLTTRGVQYLHAAVSDRSGSIGFFLQKRRGTKPLSIHCGSNSLLQRLGPVETEEVAVPSVRLDEFIRDRELTGLMTAWIDVEGATGLVLEGLGDRLNDLAMVFCEVEEEAIWSDQWTWPAVHRFFAERGFRAVARDFEFARQHNVIFLRATLLEASDVRDILALHVSASQSRSESA